MEESQIYKNSGKEWAGLSHSVADCFEYGRENS